MTKYREVKPNEILQEEDEFFSGYRAQWVPTDSFGKPAGDNFRYRRPIKEETAAMKFVETVTKKVIKSGSVKLKNNAVIDITNLGHTISVYIGQGYLFGPEALRELAAGLIEMAEVLEGE